MTAHPKLPSSFELKVKALKLNPGMLAIADRAEDGINKRQGAKKGKEHHNWNGGSSFLPYCDKFNAEFRERVRDFWGRKCGNCGKPEYKNKGRRGNKYGKLDVHHVAYNKNACCGDDQKRLFIPLCTNCHAKTVGGNKEYWEKKFSEIILNKMGGRCYLDK